MNDGGELLQIRDAAVSRRLAVLWRGGINYWGGMPGFSWAQYEQNVAQLQENRSLSSRRGAVREGRALVAGLLVCGRCQRRLGVRYRGKASQPRYLCESARSNYGEVRCQSVCARIIDHEAVRLALV